MRTLTLALAVVLCASTAIAETGSEGQTGKLLQACHEYEAVTRRGKGSAQQAYDAGNCLSYIIGVIEVHAVMAVDQTAPTSDKRWSASALWCMPDGVTFGQSVAVFMKWAEAHPALWHQPRVVSLSLAFKEAWPCER